MLPNFLIVGSAKSATSSVAQSLAQHPDAFMCSPKEPNFFSTDWDKGLPWYESLFESSGLAKARGEASVGYTYFPRNRDVPKRIYDTLGDIRYVYLVRHPIQRLISHFHMIQRYEKPARRMTLRQAEQAYPYIFDASCYHHQLEQYAPFTTSEQWHVVCMEELLQNPASTLNGIHRFLGIAERSVEQMPKTNTAESHLPDPPFFSRSTLRARLKPFLPRQLNNWGRSILDSFHRPIERPVISREYEEELYRRFEPDMIKLSEFCQRDFRAIWFPGEPRCYQANLSE